MVDLVCLEDYAAKGSEELRAFCKYYYNSGAGQETSLENNRDSFKRLRLRPKCLSNVSDVDLTTNVLGIDVKMPIGIAPSAVHKLAHPDGEVATARAAEKAGVIMTLSSYSCFSPAEIRSATPDSSKWAQVYIFKPRLLTELLVRKAEENGFKAIVLTVDSPYFGMRYDRIPLAGNLSPQNAPAYMRDPDYTGQVRAYFDDSLTWEDVKWLISFTKLPVIPKGILRPDDAVKAIEAGCKAIWVSNHGGRQLDTTPAPIQVLPEIAEAVDGRVPILIDSGFRQGTDVMKALALGANMVFIGRPVLHGLTVKGEAGVEDVLRILKEELETAMKFCGTPTIKDITSDLIIHECCLHKEC